MGHDFPVIGTQEGRRGGNSPLGSEPGRKPGTVTRPVEQPAANATGLPSPTPEDRATASDPHPAAAALADHERWLRTVILARVGEAQAVDEVLQEVSLATVRGRSLPDNPDKLPAWLYRVAVTQSLLYRRKIGRRRRLEGRYRDLGGGDAGRTAEDPLSWLLRDERQTMIRRALERLPTKDAEILLLKYTENLSYRDLSQRLDISESAVEARLHRARQKMRRKLAELDVIEPEN